MTRVLFEFFESRNPLCSHESDVMRPAKSDVESGASFLNNALAVAVHLGEHADELNHAWEQLADVIETCIRPEYKFKCAQHRDGYFFVSILFSDL